MKVPENLLVELPGKTLFSRREVAEILGIGISTLDSLVKPEELPRVKIHKRTMFLRNDIEAYIWALRNGGNKNGK